MIRTARTKPREIRCVQWDDGGTHDETMEALDDIAVLLDATNRTGVVSRPSEGAWETVLAQYWPKSGLLIRTVDGNDVEVPAGAWVMVDEAGYPYPCDPDVFAARYELEGET